MSTRQKIRGKVAIITGASRGIGKGIAYSLGKKGATVVVNYNQNRKKAEEVVAKINDELCGKAMTFQADVTNSTHVKEMINYVHKKYGQIDILVNNAGGNPNNTILSSEKEWEKTINLNLLSVFLCSREVFRIMKNQKEGNIVNITSISGKRGGFAGDIDYSAAKAGIIGFTMAFARKAISFGVRVNAIAPGYIATEGLLSRPQERLEHLKATIPLGRFGYPEEVGEVVAFLISEGARYIVGETINVNGGVFMD